MNATLLTLKEIINISSKLSQKHFPSEANSLNINQEEVFAKTEQLIKNINLNEKRKATEAFSQLALTLNEMQIPKIIFDSDAKDAFKTFLTSLEEATKCISLWAGIEEKTNYKGNIKERVNGSLYNLNIDYLILQAQLLLSLGEELRKKGDKNIPIKLLKITMDKIEDWEKENFEEKLGELCGDDEIEKQIIRDKIEEKVKEEVLSGDIKTLNTTVKNLLKKNEVFALPNYENEEDYNTIEGLIPSITSNNKEKINSVSYKTWKHTHQKIQEEFNKTSTPFTTITIDQSEYFMWLHKNSESHTRKSIGEFAHKKANGNNKSINPPAKQKNKKSKEKEPSI